MRTTLNIADEELAFAQSYSQTRGIKLGDAVSELIRSGLEKIQNGVGVRTKLAPGTKDLWVFDLPTATPKMTVSELAKILENDAAQQDDAVISGSWPMQPTPARKVAAGSAARTRAAPTAAPKVKSRKLAA